MEECTSTCESGVFCQLVSIIGVQTSIMICMDMYVPKWKQYWTWGPDFPQACDAMLVLVDLVIEFGFGLVQSSNLHFPLNL